METEKKKSKELVAKVKFWFGESEPIFDTDKYIVEYEGQFAYIFKK
jgi:hypothetical protein